MARDENGAALVSEPAKQPAQPADALRVQPVRRFVQHDRPRVSEQRGGQAEALPHPHRVAADLAPCGITQPDQLEHLVGSRHRQAGHRAEDAQVVVRRASRVEARRLERRPRRPAWGCAAGGTAGRRWLPAQQSGGRDRAPCAAWWSDRGDAIRGGASQALRLVVCCASARSAGAQRCRPA